MGGVPQKVIHIMTYKSQKGKKNGREITIKKEIIAKKV